MITFHKLAIKEISKEGENAVAILFDIPENLQETYKFIPGQYITIKKELNGKKLRRAYSISSLPSAKNLRIGVKAVDKGQFSTYATRELKVGDILEVSEPEGRFTLQPNPQNSKSYLAFVAGSGITPILSMIKSVLEIEKNSRFVLVFGNRSVSETMFFDEITKLLEAYPKNFFVQFVFSRKAEEEALFGRIDTAVINFIWNKKFKDFNFDQIFLCGPEPLINLAKEVLASKGVDPQNVHFELFTSELGEKVNEEMLDGKTKVTVILDDETTTFIMDKEQTILNVALEEGLDPPYSCQGGVCSTCLAQIKDGHAKMDKNSILTDDEIEEGLILTCRAHPTTDSITIDYDEV
ncbi:MAG: flavodoxin reductase [Flavobacteriales bacterium]|nr:MAG: flavodoxin reductase [Flavobacteriales bacterium]